MMMYAPEMAAQPVQLLNMQSQFFNGLNVQPPQYTA